MTLAYQYSTLKNENLQYRTSSTNQHTILQRSPIQCEQMWRQVPMLAAWHTAYGGIRQTEKVTG